MWNMIGVQSQLYLTLQLVSAAQVISEPSDAFVILMTISSSSYCSNLVMGNPLKRVETAGAVQTNLLLSGADKT